MAKQSIPPHRQLTPQGQTNPGQSSPSEKVEPPSTNVLVQDVSRDNWINDPQTDAEWIAVYCLEFMPSHEVPKFLRFMALRTKSETQIERVGQILYTKQPKLIMVVKALLIKFKAVIRQALLHDAGGFPSSLDGEIKAAGVAAIQTTDLANVLTEPRY
jgi:hypothetical protein